MSDVVNITIAVQDQVSATISTIGTQGAAGEVDQSAIEAIAFSYITLNDSGLVAEYRLTAQDGRVEYFPVAGGTTEQLAFVSDLDDYVLTSAMQAELSNKQDAAAFLTTLVGIGGTSGSGNLARVTSPTFVTPTLGVASATSVTIGGTGELKLGTTASLFNESSQNQVYFRYGGAYGVAIRANSTPRIYMYGIGGPASAAGTGLLAWANTTLDGNPSTTISEQAKGVVQIGTTAANALGSLACLNVTASGTVTTPKVENNASHLILNGNGRIQFQTAGFDRFQIGPSNHFFPSIDAVYDVGISANRVRGFYGGSLDLTALAKLGVYTVATLPSASSNSYCEANVSDSLAPAIGSTVASGGSAKAKVWSNGTNWIVVGK